MRTRIVKGTMNISSDGDIEFHTFGGDLTFSAGGKNEWTSPQTIVGAYEPIKFPLSQNNSCTCNISKPAKNFKELISLVKQAEEVLIKNGYESMGDRISILRGIYYGTEWSLDYKVEKSKIRNIAFKFYVGSSVVADARDVLKCCELCKANLFNSLFDSFEVFDSKHKAVDFGHIIIGLDARRSYIAKNITMQGGTGLEICTWVGDLGGGVGKLSNDRIKEPKKRAKILFPVEGSSYGAMVNIEGDVAAYIIGSKSESSDIKDPTETFTTIHEALEYYFNNQWNKRAYLFLTLLGATFENKRLKNKDELLNKFAGAFKDFAFWYLTVRLNDKNRDGDLNLASSYFEPVSEEVASIFLDALMYSFNNPNDMIIGRADPDPKPKVYSNLNKINDTVEEVKKKVSKKYRKTKEKASEFYKKIENIDLNPFD